MAVGRILSVIQTKLAYQMSALILVSWTKLVEETLNVKQSIIELIVLVDQDSVEIHLKTVSLLAAVVIVSVQMIRVVSIQIVKDHVKSAILVLLPTQYVRMKITEQFAVVNQVLLEILTQDASLNRSQNVLLMVRCNFKL